MLRLIPTCLALACAPLVQASDILISGVIDGPLSGGTPKAVELYVINDIPDLSLCGLGSANNGGGTDNEEFTFPAVSANAGEYIYVASESTQFANFLGVAPDYTTNAMAINGDDAIELFCNDVVVDVFGDINVDGNGEDWEYLDGWAYRVSNTGPDGSAFTLANWIFSGPTALDGESTNLSATTPFPIGTFGGAGDIVDAAPTVTSSTPEDGDTDVAIGSDITITFSEEVSVIGWNDVVCDNGSHSVSPATTDNVSYTLTPLTDYIAGESCSITVFAADVSDVDGAAFDNLAEDFTLNFSVAAAQADTGSSDLILTGVIDGPLSGGIPKAVEIFVVNDIADLSNCGVGSANNGGGSDGEEFSFPADSATAGQFIYVASEDTGFSNFFGFAPDYTTGAMAINGDDAVELFCGGEVVDVFGDINIDGNGEAWEYLDGWASRVANTGPDGDTFVLGNWTFSGPRALDGQSTNDTASVPFPLASFFVEEKLIITGVFDGPLSGGVPKFVEFYAATDIEDLSVFGFGSANNGGGSDGEEYTFSGSASAGDYIYIAYESAGFNTFFGFSPDDTNSAANINGDDAIELFKDGEVVDVFGDINTDGNGEAWEYLDGWAYRNAGTGPDGSTFVIANWMFSGPNALDGETSNDSAATPFPLASFVGSGDNGGGDDGDIPAIDVKIHEVQGSGDSTPLEDGQAVIIEGIVVGDFQDGEAGTHGDLNGFFVQEESDEFDNDPSTSEGIFVFDNENPSVDVQVGDKVQVKGTVSEFFEATQITASEVTVVSSDKLLLTELIEITLPTATTYTNSDGDLVGNLEAYEGMWVQFAQVLSVTELFNLDRFGEMGLVEGSRLFQFTQLNSPDVAGYQAHLEDVAKRTVTLDDGLTVQNPNPIRYPSPGLSTDNPVRMGDEVTNLEGVITYSFDLYRLLPTTVEPAFTQPTQREDRPDVGGTLSVASYNVLNFFNTLDAEGSAGCYPDFDRGDCRGADSQEEFDRQLEKLVTALVELDADIVGLIEIENDIVDGTDSSIAQLIEAINGDERARSCETYDYVDPGVRAGTDAIAVGFVYCADTVEIMSDTSIEILDDDDLPGLELGDLVPLFSGPGSNRAVLATSFTEIESGESLTIAINHFKSKGSSCGEGDDDTATGQGNCNLTRINAALALHTWLATDPTGSGDADFLIMGDLNAYAKEDPIVELETNGYTNVITDPSAYSFVFEGQAGNLDHGLANASLLEQITDAKDWHINADEADALDYNLDFGRPADIFDGSVPFRSSDHDPLIIGIELSSASASVPGDWDQDGDVDINDIQAFFTAISLGQEIDESFDLNGDGLINIFDVYVMYSMCTRAGCVV